MPVALLPLDACHVFEGVHLYIVRKVPRQQLCHQETISEVPEAEKETFQCASHLALQNRGSGLPFRIFDGVCEV